MLLTSPSWSAFGFFLITFNTLFFSASLSLLSLFYFQVQSVLFKSYPCLIIHFSNSPIINLKSGSCSNFKFLQYSMNSLNSGGYPLQSSSKVVSIFFFLIFAYFSFLLLPGRPYHGKLPLRKYKRTCPIVSKSSLLDCSTPLCVLILA